MATIHPPPGQPTPHPSPAPNTPSSQHGSIIEIDSANFQDPGLTSNHPYAYNPNSAAPYPGTHVNTLPIPGPSMANYNFNGPPAYPSSQQHIARESPWKTRGGRIVYDGPEIAEVASNADTADLQAVNYEDMLPPDTAPPPAPLQTLGSFPPSRSSSFQNSPGPPTVPNSPILSQMWSSGPLSRMRTETNISDSMSLLGSPPVERGPILDQANVASRLADMLEQPRRRAFSPYHRPPQAPPPGSRRFPNTAPRPRRGGSLLSRSATPADFNLSPLETDSSGFPPQFTSSPPPSQYGPGPQTYTGPRQEQPAPQRQSSPPRQTAPQRTSPSPESSRGQSPPPSQNQGRPPSPPSPQPSPSQPQRAQTPIEPFRWYGHPPQFDPPGLRSGYTGYPDPDPPSTPGEQYMPSPPQVPPFPLHAHPGLNPSLNANAAWQPAASHSSSSHAPDTRGAWSGPADTAPWPPPTSRTWPQPGSAGFNHTPNAWLPRPGSVGNLPQATYTPFVAFSHIPPRFTRPEQRPTMSEGNNQGFVSFAGFPQQQPPLPTQPQQRPTMAECNSQGPFAGFPQHPPPPFTPPHQRQPRTSPHRHSSPRRSASPEPSAGHRDSKGKQREGFAPSFGAPRFQSTPPKNPPVRRAGGSTPPESASELLEANLRNLEFAMGDIGGLTLYFGSANRFHDVNPHTTMSQSVRVGLQALTAVLMEHGSLSQEQLQLGTQQWHEKCVDRLGSLWRTIHNFGRFAHAISGREPTISTLTKALTKLSEFESKFSNLASKFSSLLNRLRVRQLYSRLARAHAEANDQLRNAQSRRDVPDWEEGRKHRAELRREYVDFRNRLARARRASLNS